MKKQNLTPEIILNKKFSTELSGYNAKEVDEYIDKILEDYHLFHEHSESLELRLSEKASLVSDKEEEIKKLNLKIQNITAQLKKSEKASQFEILQAIEGLKVKKVGN